MERRPGVGSHARQGASELERVAALRGKVVGLKFLRDAQTGERERRENDLPYFQQPFSDVVQFHVTHFMKQDGLLLALWKCKKRASDDDVLRAEPPARFYEAGEFDEAPWPERVPEPVPALCRCDEFHRHRFKVRLVAHRNTEAIDQMPSAGIMTTGAMPVPVCVSAAKNWFGASENTR